MQKQAKNSITLISVPEATSYFLLPSATYITVSTNGELSDTNITCKAYKQTSVNYNELDSSEGTIYYSIVTGSTESALHAYTDDGVTVLKTYTKVRFYLQLTGRIDYISHIDVPIITNGQLDDKFQIWVGTSSTAPDSSYRPWEDGDDDSHVGDYYVNSYMTYYLFVKTGTDTYGWQEITDKILKDILNRTEQSTLGFYVTKGEEDEYFADETYYFGDLMYLITKDDKGNTIAYDLYYCISSMDTVHGYRYKASDWQIASDVKQRLVDTGIDVGRNTITVTADNFRFLNESNEEVAVINTYSGYPKINTSLIQIDGTVVFTDDSKVSLIETTANNASSTASAALTAANNAETAASTAQTTASGAQTTADNALETANSASSTANSASTTANEAKTGFTNLSTGLSNGTTTISGNCITTGIVNAQYLAAAVKLAATEGTIGGWNIDGSNIYSGCTTPVYNSETNKYDYVPNPFVSNTDDTFTSGICINSEYKAIGIVSSTAKGTRYIEMYDGTLKANDVDLTGKITATSGKIGGWIINNNNLQTSATYYLLHSDNSFKYDLDSSLSNATAIHTCYLKLGFDETYGSYLKATKSSSLTQELLLNQDGLNITDSNVTKMSLNVDGSGWLANKNINWNSTGSITGPYYSYVDFDTKENTVGNTWNLNPDGNMYFYGSGKLEFRTDASIDGYFYTKLEKDGITVCDDDKDERIKITSESLCFGVSDDTKISQTGITFDNDTKTITWSEIYNLIHS